MNRTAFLSLSLCSLPSRLIFSHFYCSILCETHEGALVLVAEAEAGRRNKISGGRHEIKRRKEIWSAEGEGGRKKKGKRKIKVERERERNEEPADVVCAVDRLTVAATAEANDSPGERMK